MPPVRTALIAVAALLTGGCAYLVPSAERPQVQQGNVLRPADIEQIRSGQPRARVRELLGPPVLATSFHVDRWDYVYYRVEAGRDVKTAQRFSVFFGRDDRVARIVDDYRIPEDPVPAGIEKIPSVDTGTNAPTGGQGQPSPGPGPDQPGS